MKCYFMCLIATIFFGGVISMKAEGRVEVRKVEYTNIGLDELVSVYSQAYIRAGFMLNERKTQLTDAGKQQQTHLRFSYVKSGRHVGGASFIILSPNRRDKVCFPCSLIIETFGPLIDHAREHPYDANNINSIRAEIELAGRKADAEIKVKLGKGIW